MNNVEVKVNVINQLKLFKTATFKDKLCFLDEDIQNAQRAKATEVRVTVDEYRENNVIIENNGKILDNPQSLFSIAESGWDNEVMNTENPFGIGFFSNITVSDDIEIYSGNKYIKFDVNKMISENNPQLEVIELDEDEYYNGFKLVLNNFNFDNVYEFQIRERVERLGKYIQNLDIYYNDEKQNKTNLFESDKDYCFYKEINDDSVKGWIAIGSKYSWDTQELAIYYKGRFVTELSGFSYIRGDLHINDKTLNLTSPDRKDIIRDDKFDNFKKLIKSYIKEMVEESFLTGDEEDIEDYNEAINFYLDKSKAIKNTKFNVFKNSKGLDYLKGIAKARRNNKNINNFKGYNKYLDSKNSEQQESNVEEITVEGVLKSNIPEAKGIIYHEGSVNRTESYIETPHFEDKQLEEKDGDIINREDIIFWMKFNELETYEYKFNILNHYGLKLIVARNKVEEGLLKSLESNNSYNVHHIIDLRENITFSSTISNTELNIKEKRALMIFGYISNILGEDHNLFSIGDVMTTKMVKVNSTDISTEMIDDNVTIISDNISKKVYVDRSIIELSRLQEDLDEKFTLEDIQFILMNLNNIIDSLKLVIDKSENEIRNELLMKLAYME